MNTTINEKILLNGGGYEPPICWTYFRDGYNCYYTHVIYCNLWVCFHMQSLAASRIPSVSLRSRAHTWSDFAHAYPRVPRSAHALVSRALLPGRQAGGRWPATTVLVAALFPLLTLRESV